MIESSENGFKSAVQWQQTMIMIIKVFLGMDDWLLLLDLEVKGTRASGIFQNYFAV